MIAGAKASIRAQHAMLSELDCVAGDGDHGATMLRVVEQLDKTFAPGGPEDLATCLRDAGWNVLGVDGGASSSLFGLFFGGMADAAPHGTATGASDLAAMFEAGLANMRKQTKAQPGDKTMLDALVPAVDAMRAAADAGKSTAEALRLSAEAARAGAEATENQAARFGRAKLLGERTHGHADPGAVSVSLMFEGFYNGFQEFTGGSGNA